MPTHWLRTIVNKVTDDKNDVTCKVMLRSLPRHVRENNFSHKNNGKISAQPHTTLCIRFLDIENNDKNNTLPLGKQICFTIVWGYAEILPP